MKTVRVVWKCGDCGYTGYMQCDSCYRDKFKPLGGDRYACAKCGTVLKSRVAYLGQEQYGEYYAGVRPTGVPAYQHVYRYTDIFRIGDLCGAHWYMDHRTMSDYTRDVPQPGTRKCPNEGENYSCRVINIK